MTRNNRKTLKNFNIAGTLSTVCSILLITFSLLCIFYYQTWFYYAIELITIVSFIDSIVWLGYAIIIVNQAHNIKPEHKKRIKATMTLAILMVLTPQILVLVVFFLPSLKTANWINFISLFSPVIVFIGRHLGGWVGNKLYKK